MAKLDDLTEELVTANRILAREGVVDSFGHISVRHPDNPQRYLLSRSRAPDCIERDDIMEFTLDGTPVDPRGRAPYLEVNARLQKQAMDMGEVKFLTAGEVDKVSARTGSYGINRAWENWCRRAGRPFRAEQG